MLLSRRAKRVALGFLAVGLVVAFIVLASARYIEARREAQRFEQERAGLRAPPPALHTIVEEAPVLRRSFSAELLPWRQARVPAQVPGVVIGVSAEPGQAVRAGDPLVRLDDSRARIALALAEARHTEAMRLLSEAERLQKSRVVSQTAYEAALAEARITKAQVDDAADLLARHVIRAPFDGHVNRRHVDVGDAVNANQPAVDVVDTSRLRVRFDVAEGDLGAFEPGTKITLRLPAFGGDAIEIPVEHRARSAEPATGLFRVEALLENADGWLPGGARGIVEAGVAAFPRAPVVPAAAVRFEGRRGLVMKLGADGEPVETPVVLGAEVDGVYPVLEGLAAGDRILFR